MRLGLEEFRIIRAADPLTRARLIGQDPARGGLQMNVDAGAARYVGMLWLLAARSRRSLIYLPLRGGGLPAGGTQYPPEEPPLDLVLLHHSLQFKPHHWKRLRGGLGRGAEGTVRLSPDDLPGDGTIDYDARRRRGYRDVFHQHVHAETMFMVGSAKVFRETAGMFFDVFEHGHRYHPPAELREDVGLHYCEELDDPLAGSGREIHIQYTRRWVG
ncbi:hypothetical protein ACQEU6_03385 [Spirillospora sp. CA-108201]